MTQNLLYSSPVSGTRNQSYRSFMDNPQTLNYDSGGLASTARPSYNFDTPIPSINDLGSGQPAWKSGELNLNTAGMGQGNAMTFTGTDPTMWQKFKSGVSNYGKDSDGKYCAQGTPLMRDLTAVGGLGLGIASFLEQRKTAGLQRDALRHDIATAKEQRANRQAMADSWNRAWSK